VEIKRYPYFQCLKKNNHFAWTSECEEAFAKLKEYLASPPVLGKLIPGQFVFIFFNRSDYQLDHFARLGEDLEASLFRKQGATGTRASISSYRESCPSCGVHSSAASPLLSELHRDHIDRPAHP